MAGADFWSMLGLRGPVIDEITKPQPSPGKRAPSKAPAQRSSLTLLDAPGSSVLPSSQQSRDRDADVLGQMQGGYRARKQAEAAKLAHAPVRPSAVQWDTPGQDPRESMGTLFGNQAAGRSTTQAKALNEQQIARGDYLRRKSMLNSQLAGEYTVREATAEEWAAMNPQQRAAVEANTAMVEAINADKAAGKTAAAAKDKDYTKQVTGLFGSDGGSDTYAPRTVALLQQLGLGQKINDLDNYLNLSALTTESDLKSVGGPAALGGRLAGAQRYGTKATSTLAAILKQGQTLLDTARGNTTPALGFDTSDENDQTTQLLDKFYTSLAVRDNPNRDPAQLGVYLGELEQGYGLDSQAVFDYLEKRLAQQEYEGAATGQAQPDRLSPEEFRAAYYSGGK